MNGLLFYVHPLLRELLVSYSAYGSSLLLALMCWYTLLQRLGRYPYNNRQLKQVSTSILRLGPPSTPPVNLANSRITGQNDIDSLLEQGPISGSTARPLRLYDTTQRVEFHAAGGAGKLVLPQHLDPTSSGFIPGRLLYGPPIPEPAKKAKAKKWQTASKSPDFGQINKRRSLLSESHSNRNSQNSVGFSVTVLRKPPPALPSRIVDRATLSIGPRSYLPPLPQQASFVRQHHSHSDTWEKPKGAVSSEVEKTDLPPPLIPSKHLLRRISSAPPGSLDLRPAPPGLEMDYYGPLRSETALKPPRLILDSPASWSYESLPEGDITKSVLAGPSAPPVIRTKFNKYPSIQTGNEPAIKTVATSTRITASGSKVGVPPHTPRTTSNLTLSFNPADLDTSGVGRGYEDQQLSAPSEENSWEGGAEELLYRTGYDIQSPSNTPDFSSVISSDTLPQPSVLTGVASAITTSEEPNIGPLKHQGTYSSEESDESLELDPEKMELTEKEKAANQQAAKENSQTQRTHEMAEIPESPSLTLPLRSLAHIRSVSSPMPLPIPSAHPVLQLSHGVVSRTTLASQLRPMQSAMNSASTVASDTSFNHHQYTMVAPLTITKKLPPLSKLPPLKIITPPSKGGGFSSVAPPTPRSLRTPIADLKTQCVGHFTVSPTGEVEMSTQIPVGGSSPYRGRIESVSSTQLNIDWGGSNSTGRQGSSALEPNVKQAEGGGSSLEPAPQLPVTRKRSKSEPLGTTVELSKNEILDGRTWGTNSSAKKYQRE
ncbi:hypothetical protein EV426DRAFT_17589 [Tirmania nivea]|nr:hypothetical protein EV426DRAFT_17589 [Tirmania nivea]